ncbi:hypothetical protein [Mycolicibacter sinensis]|uniref:hypothetical protein n=1 Tax=Mycolicibacter sinensis (strain JDM601) TaxID=875328 RepID=UPI0007EAA0A6|nr:hypothetical protein [Mycolicibacter sinensis]OBH17059.1 hypothetical protein A5694_04895 [Mycolicibacter sinensis]
MTTPKITGIQQHIDKSGNRTILALPKHAHLAEMLALGDGSVVLRWYEHDGSHGDEPGFWSVMLSADGGTVNVEITYESLSPDLGYVLDVLRHVLQYVSGTNVTISMKHRQLSA